MSNSRIVYSTDNGSQKDDELTGIHHPKPSQQKVRLHLDRRGGGKIVTVIKGLVHEDEIMINLTKELKKRCGVGGSFKNDKIHIQGNKRDLVKEILSKKGYDVKLSGG
tara:strand:+ start:300 stop:623 length:324 start_codon:yes stop_codon:yes gene_type:complete